MGGRGANSIRKGFANTAFAKGTKTAKTKAKEATAEVGGGGSSSEASMLKEFSDWKASLNKDQIAAFAAYTNGSYVKMNSDLRGISEGGAGTKAQNKALISSFNHTLTKDVTVYRGTGTADAKLLKEMTTVGGVFRDKGAFSTSLSKTFARSWASSHPNSVVYTVRLPKGFKNSAYVQSISPHKSEKELLIKPGQNWRIVKQLESLNGRPHYEITPV